MEFFRKMPAHKIILAVILAAYLAIAAAYSFIIPLNHAPDEPWHFGYVESLAEGEFPSLERTHESQHPPLYYLLAAAIYAPATYVLSPEWAERTVRLFSALIGLVTLLVTYRLAMRIFRNLLPPAGSTDGEDSPPGERDTRGPAPSPYTGRDGVGSGRVQAEPLALFAVAFVAFTPLFGAMSGVVNNDCLTVLLAALFMLQLAELPAPPTNKRLVLLGATLGLALLTKQSTMALAPLIIPAAYWALPRERRGTRLISSCGLVYGVAAVVFGWWLIRNRVVMGSFLVYSTVPGLQSEFRALPFVDFGRALGVAATVARWAGGSLFFPEWVVRYWGFPYFAILGDLLLVLTLVGALLFPRLKKMAVEIRRFALLALGEMLLLYLGLLAYVFTVDFRAWVGGRYLLPALPTLVIPLSLGVRGLLPPGKRGRRAIVALIAVGLVIGCAFLTAVRWHYLRLYYQMLL